MGLKKYSDKNVYIPLDKEMINLWRTERQRNLGLGVISEETE